MSDLLFTKCTQRHNILHNNAVSGALASTRMELWRLLLSLENKLFREINISKRVFQVCVSTDLFYQIRRISIFLMSKNVLMQGIVVVIHSWNHWFQLTCIYSITHSQDEWGFVRIYIPDNSCWHNVLKLFKLYDFIIKLPNYLIN